LSASRTTIRKKSEKIVLIFPRNKVLIIIIIIIIIIPINQSINQSEEED